MGEPRDAEFERQVRRQIHARYKAKAAACNELYRLLAQANARILVLEHQLEAQAELVEMAERVISDGTVKEDGQ